MADRPRHAAPQAALRDRAQAAAAERARAHQRHAGPAAREDRREHGRRPGDAAAFAARRRGHRPHDHHRSEAARAQGEEVDRQLQAPRGQRDRRQGDAARRPDVGVLRPAREPRDPAHPRLPRACRRSSSTGTATTRSGSPNSSCSRRSTTTRSTRVRGMNITIVTTAETDDQGRALLRRSASRSAATGRGESMAKKALDQQAAAHAEVQGARRTRAAAAAVAHARCTATSGSADSACARWRTPGRSPA